MRMYCLRFSDEPSPRSFESEPSRLGLERAEERLDLARYAALVIEHMFAPQEAEVKSEAVEVSSTPAQFVGETDIDLAVPLSAAGRPRRRTTRGTP